MIRIVFICSLISIARSEECNLNNTELHRLQSSFRDAATYMEKKGQSNAIVCIGAARAGKSTLINYLIGNELKAVKTGGRAGKTIIEAVDTTKPGPEIGPGTLSKTIMPSKWNSVFFQDMVLWDSPGFGDNRGPVTDISNAFYLYQLIKNVNSLKIVLVINFEDIRNDNVQSFLNLLMNLENFFGQSFETYFSSITVIFSKAPYMDDYENKIDNEFMSETLNEQIIKSKIPDVSNICKKFVTYIKDHNNHIAFFRKITKPGKLPSNIADNIVEAITDSTLINKGSIKNLHPSISQSSQLCLHSARKDLLATPKLIEIQKFVTDQLMEQENRITSINSTSPGHELENIRNDLNRIKQLLLQFEGTNKDVIEGIELLKSINPSVANKIEQDDLVASLNTILFVDLVLNARANEQLRLTVKSIFATSLAIVDHSITAVFYKEGQISKERYEKEMADLLTEFNKKIQSLEQQLAEQKNSNKGGALHFIIDPLVDGIEYGVNSVYGFFRDLFSG